MNLKRCLQGSLLLLALVAGSASTAAAAPTFGDCPDLSGDPSLPSSAVLSSTEVGNPTTYSFKVCNTSFDPRRNETLDGMFVLRDWELPYDPLGGIVDVVVPDGWGWAIETIGKENPATGWDGDIPTWFAPGDPFYDPRYLGLTQVLHFYTCDSGGLDFSVCEANDSSPFGAALTPGDSLEGFGFKSPYGPTSAPYQASWVRVPPRSGDPDFPAAGGPNTPGLRTVSEPGILALVAAGLLIAGMRRRRSRG